jgi:hypothetical protein
MGNGNAFAQPCAAKALARAQTFENLPFGEVFAVAGQFLADEFEQALLAAALDVELNPFRTQQITDKHMGADDVWERLTGCGLYSLAPVHTT